MARFYDVMTFVDARQLEIEICHKSESFLAASNVRPIGFRTPLDLVKLLYLVIAFKPSVVHLQEAVGPRRGFFVACLATLMKPFSIVVVTVHDPKPHTGRDEARARRTGWSRDYVRKIADLIIVHGSFCARVLEASAGFKTAIVSSEHGLILQPPELRPFPDLPMRLYFFGRMEAYKGVEVLLTVVERLHEEGFPFKLRIEGRGPELDKYQERFNRLPEVTVCNEFIPTKRIIESIQDAECVLLPYLNASQSGVLAAAYAGCRYVIASDTGGLSDVVSHMQNGILVPPGDAHALTAAIKLLSSDEGLRVRLREGAAVIAETKLDWNRIGCELDAVFQKYTRGHRKRFARQSV